MTAALRFRNVTLGYDRHPAVHHLDGAVEKGALVAVIGPNGAGKSTLFKGVVGVLKPLAGSIDRDGLVRARAALAPRAAHRAGGASRSRSRQGQLSRGAAARARAGRLGPHR